MTAAGRGRMALTDATTLKELNSECFYLPLELRVSQSSQSTWSLDCRPLCLFSIMRTDICSRSV